MIKLVQEAYEMFVKKEWEVDFDHFLEGVQVLQNVSKREFKTHIIYTLLLTKKEVEIVDTFAKVYEIER